jgi:hypothetical protein
VQEWPEGVPFFASEPINHAHERQLNRWPRLPPNVEIVSSEFLDALIDLLSHLCLARGLINMTERAKRRLDINVAEIRENADDQLGNVI